MASRLTQPLQRLRRKLVLAVWLGRSARQGALVLALAGSAILVARVAFELETEESLWLLLPLAVVPFTAWRGVRERVPSEAGAAAWLDLRSGAQGYLLADYEQADDRWRTTLTRQLDRLPELPAVRLTPLTRLLLPASAFAALALFVPLSKAQSGPSTSYYDRAIEGLANQLEVLDDVVGLEDQVADELQRRVENLAENVDAEQPEAMLEAIDGLRKELGLEGQEAAELTQELLERFGAIGEQALGNSGLAQELMAGQLNEMLESGMMSGYLSELDTLIPQFAKLSEQMAGNQLQLPEGFELTPEQMQALSRVMQSELRGALGELELAGLANLKGLKLGGGVGALSKLIEAFHKHDDSCLEPGGT